MIDGILNPNEKHTLSMMVVSADLIKKNYQIFQKITVESMCDIIAMKEDRIEFIKVWSGAMKRDKVYFPRKIDPRVTAVAVYVHSINCLFWYSPTLEERDL